jgi:hypothetical protein
MDKKTDDSSDKKPQSNFVDPRIRFTDDVPTGTARVFDAAGDGDASILVTFDASTGAVSLDDSNSSITVRNKKATIAFNLTVSNLPTGAAAQIAGVEFMKPNEPSGTFDCSNVFEDASSFNDGNGAAHTVYGKWRNGQSELQLIDDNNVPSTGTEQDYGYKVWVKLTPGSGSANYYASPDPEVKNEPTT